MIVTATTTLRLVSHEDCDSDTWDAYVAQHPSGTVFHSRAIARAFQAVGNYSPFAKAALNDQGEIVAVLVAARISVLPTLAALSSRSVAFAEPICNASSEGQQGLSMLLEEHDRWNPFGTLFAEIRAIGNTSEIKPVLLDAGYQYMDYLNYVVDLRADEEMLASRLSKSCRKSVKKSLSRGVEVRVDNSHEGIDRFYPLVQASYRRSKVPLVEAQLFHTALDELPSGVFQLRLAYWQGNVVAAGVGLVANSRFYAWYGGSERPSGVSPFDALTWDEIKWGAEQGLDYYDFGGAGWPDKAYGPRDFKAKFGGQRVCFGRYRRIYSRIAMQVAVPCFQMLRRLF